MFTRSFSVLAT